MVERSLAKIYGRLHLHPVESCLWDGDVDGVEASIMQWGLPPTLEMMAVTLVERVDGAKRLGLVETLLVLHQDGVVSTGSVRAFLSSLLVVKSFGNRKILTKLLTSAFELVQQKAPTIIDQSLTNQIIHLAFVNDSEDLLRSIRVSERSLEPTPPIMFALVDACSTNSFSWVKPYAAWNELQQADFLDLFMAQCVRRHPSNKRQGEVLRLILADGIPAQFQFNEKDVATKESVRSTILALGIRVDPVLIHKAPPDFRLAMVRAGLFTSNEAKVKGKTIDKLMAIDLGL